MGNRRSRLRYSNRTKVLLCYLAAFGLPVLWMLAGFFWGYPYKLAGSAPHIAETLLGLFPGQARLTAAASAAETPAGAAPELWRLALRQREEQWLLFWAAVWAAAWLLTLLLQLGWRLRHSKPCFAARNTRRAIRDYRLTQTVIWAVNLAGAAALWLLGVQFVQGRTGWDYAIYFSPFLLNALAAVGCFRLAAPPILSGKGAFFKRL